MGRPGRPPGRPRHSVDEGAYDHSRFHTAEDTSPNSEEIPTSTETHGCSTTAYSAIHADRGFSEQQPVGTLRRLDFRRCLGGPARREPRPRDVAVCPCTCSWMDFRLFRRSADRESVLANDRRRNLYSGPQQTILSPGSGGTRVCRRAHHEPWWRVPVDLGNFQNASVTRRC